MSRLNEWVVTKDIIDNGCMEGAGSYDDIDPKTLPDKFKLFDDDDNCYFRGKFDMENCGEEGEFAPLDNLGAAYGCTYLMYMTPEMDQYEML